MGIWGKLFERAKARVFFTYGGAIGRARFNKELYEQVTIRSVIDCIATHTAKAEALHIIVDENERIKEVRRNSPYAKMLNMSPNPYMTGYDFKYKLITHVEENTTALAWIQWDGMKPKMMVPIAYSSFDIFPIVGGGYAVQFVYDGESYTLNLEDMVVLRKFFNRYDISGDGNSAIYPTLDMMHAANEGLIEALTVSNKVRGLLKQKKAMLDPEDVKKSTDEFAVQFEEAAKNGGVVGVDSTAEYTPLTANTWAANAAQMKDIRENILRYWRISEPILTSNYTESQWQAFYESVIEPRLLQMSQAFTVACFTPTERGHGNRIAFNTSTLMHSSIQTKINILSASRELGLFTTNELRDMFGYPPVEDGDTRKVSLNYVNADKQNEYQLGEKEGSEKDGEEELT